MADTTSRDDPQNPTGSQGEPGREQPEGTTGRERDMPGQRHDPIDDPDIEEEDVDEDEEDREGGLGNR
jgi:hypothetical protein